MRRSIGAKPAGVVLALALVLGIAPEIAEEVKVMQGMDLSLYSIENQGNDSSPFVRLQAPADWTLSPTLYADYTLRFQTPSGVSGQIIASAQGATPTTLVGALDQAWIKATFGEGWGIAFGQRVLNDWKDSGGYWNPSDIVNNYLNWGVIGQAPGKYSVELFGLMSIADINIDLNAATVLPASIDSPADLPFYFTAGSILDPLELRLKAAVQVGRLPYLGATARYSLQSGVVYADGLWLQDQPIGSEFDMGPTTGSWFRYSGGVQWTFDISESKLAQSLFIQGEYLRQDDGLDSTRMSSYFNGLAAMPLATTSEQSLYAAASGLWNGRFFALGRNYIYGSFSIGEIANAHIGLSAGGVLNVDQLSFAIQSSLTWSPRNLFSIAVSATNFGGRAGGEAQMLPYESQYSLTLSRSF